MPEESTLKSQPNIAPVPLRRLPDPVQEKPSACDSGCCDHTATAAIPLVALKEMRHKHANGPASGEAHVHRQSPDSADCCAAGACSAEVQPMPASAADAAGLLLRIPAMDCPVEEGQIRRALEQFPQIRRLVFDLPGGSH